MCGELVTFKEPSQTCHTCGKAGHSCLRTIVSFFNIPRKRVFRKNARCLDSLVSELRPWYDLGNITVAADELRTRYELMRTPPAGIEGDH